MAALPNEPPVAEAAPLLEAGGLAKHFGPVVALRSADLRVHAGEIHALMGANGAGKSTLVKILTGALTADAGTIKLGGRPRSFSNTAEARKAGLICVYQDPSLLPDLTVMQNLKLTATPVDTFRRYLDKLGLGGFDLQAIPRELARPTLSLLDLARALAIEPQLLLLDEITASLPADLTVRVFNVARQLRSELRSVIFISHRLAEVSALCDRATVLRDGRTVGIVEPAQGGEERIVKLMLGPVAEEVTGAAAAQAAPSAQEVAVEVRDLKAGILTGVSFSLRFGEVLGVAALEGQGQQELFDCLAGVRRPESGQIVVSGKARTFRHPADAIRAGLVLIPADRLQALLRQRSVRENIALPLVNRIRRWGPISPRGEKRRVESAVKRLQIDTRVQSEVRRLSGGNQQKVVVARWLAGGFKTLLCFDPTRGIDIGTKRQIYGLVKEVAANGAAVLLFTSELPEIQLACNRVIVLFGGQLVDEMPAAEADEAALLRAAHGLHSEAEAT
ncbi:MAG TPA: sugar ABC transporter ATP-binding protein [Candidatus Dormibacteraeota bacterium]|nr:sugar ABC transporter ATP-binding protein [Candidatus Dormibacteraeota bacterium]